MADRKIISSPSRDDVVVLPVNRQSSDVGRYIPTIEKSDFVIPEEPGLRDYWRIIWRHRMAVLLIFAVIVALVLVSSLLATPTYRASLSLKIEREAPKILNYQEVDPGESAFDKDFYQTQYELLKSRTLVNRVIDQLDLTSNAVFTRQSAVAGTLAWLSGIFAADVKSQEADLGQRHRLVEHFLDQLTVEPVKRSRLVKVHYESPDPVLAAKVANTLVENFISMNLERRFEASSYAKSFLENRLRQVKSKLEESEKKLVHFARDQEIINVDETRSVTGAKLEEMNVALVQAEKERIAAEARYRAALKGGVNIGDEQDNPVIQQLKQTRANLEAEYRDKLAVYKPAYPLMLQLQGQIGEIQSQIDREVAGGVSMLKMNFDEAKQKEELVDEELTALKDKMLALQDRSIQYNILKREVDTNREMYDGLLQRLKEVGVGAGATTNNVSVIDQADVPVETFRPQIALNTTLAAIIGLFFGVGFAFLIEHLDDTVKSPEDLEQRFDLPVLGVIPSTRAATIGNLDRVTDIGLLSHQEPTSGFAEAYRSVRTAFLFSTAAGAPKTLLFTSAAPGEGKTTSAVNVAITFTQTGNRVLLIDADLRKPSLHRIMDTDNGIGLTNYLTGDARPADISKNTSIDGLFLIPCGPLSPNPAELLSSEKMFSLLALAQDKFDYVVVDGPPILGLADAVILSNMVSATAVVVEAGNARRSQVEDALKRLRVAKASVVGALLTKLRYQDGGYGYHNSYYYYYNQDDGGSKSLSV